MIEGAGIQGVDRSYTDDFQGGDTIVIWLCPRFRVSLCLECFVFIIVLVGIASYVVIAFKK